MPACHPGARPPGGGETLAASIPARARSHETTEFEFHISPVRRSSLPQTRGGTDGTRSRTRLARARSPATRTHETAFGDDHDERRVVQVEPRTLVEPRTGGLEQLAAQPHDVLARPKGDPVQIYGCETAVQIRGRVGHVGVHTRSSDHKSLSAHRAERP